MVVASGMNAPARENLLHPSGRKLFLAVIPWYKREDSLSQQVCLFYCCCLHVRSHVCVNRAFYLFKDTLLKNFIPLDHGGKTEIALQSFILNVESLAFVSGLSKLFFVVNV